jgi:hypothetical protein
VIFTRVISSVRLPLAKAGERDAGAVGFGERLVEGY